MVSVRRNRLGLCHTGQASSGQFRVLRRELDSQEPPAKLRANGGRSATATEWIYHQVTGVRAAPDNAAKELHGKLGGHSLDPLAVLVS